MLRKDSLKLSRIGWPIIATFLCGGAYRLAAQQPPPRGPVQAKMIALINSAPLAPAADDDDMRKLRVDRYNAALEMVRWRYKKDRNDLRDVSDLYDQFAFLREARLDLCKTPAERIAVLEQFLEVAKEYEGNLQVAAKVDQWSNLDLQRARYGRLGLEIKQLEARREAGLALQR
jgi:hypothetical protein